MNTERDFDRMTAAWLDLMPDEAPDRVIAAVLPAVAIEPEVRRGVPGPRWVPGAIPLPAPIGASPPPLPPRPSGGGWRGSLTQSTPRAVSGEDRDRAGGGVTGVGLESASWPNGGPHEWGLDLDVLREPDAFTLQE